jgi:hypothetical protein
MVMGSVAGSGVTGNTWLLKAVGVAIFLCFIRLVYLKAQGLFYFSSGEITDEPVKKTKLYRLALDKDPENGDFLFMYGYQTFETHPQEALFAFAKSIVNFDGQRQLWGLWDNFARAIVVLNQLKIAKWANRVALGYNPVYPESRMTEKIIAERETNLQKGLEELKVMQETKEKKAIKKKYGIRR